MAGSLKANKKPREAFAKSRSLYMDSKALFKHVICHGKECRLPLADGAKCLQEFSGNKKFDNEKTLEFLKSCRERFVVKTVNGKQFIEAKSTLKLCDQYLFPCKEGGCEKRLCKRLHICRNFLEEKCCFGDRCNKPHDFNESQTRALLVDHKLDNLTSVALKKLFQKMLREHKVRYTARISGPRICIFYNKATNCSDGDKCRFLHVCENYITGDCKTEDECNRCHSFATKHARKVLATHNLGSLRNDALILSTLRRHTRVNTDSGSKTKTSLDLKLFSQLVHHGENCRLSVADVEKCLQELTGDQEYDEKKTLEFVNSKNEIFRVKTIKRNKYVEAMTSLKLCNRFMFPSKEGKCHAKSCEKLHICRSFLEGKCKNGQRCNEPHGFENHKTRGLLADHKLDALAPDVLKIFFQNVLREHKIDHAKSTVGVTVWEQNPSGPVQATLSSSNANLTSAVSSPTFFFSNSNSMLVTTDMTRLNQGSRPEAIPLFPSANSDLVMVDLANPSDQLEDVEFSSTFNQNLVTSIKTEPIQVGQNQTAFHDPMIESSSMKKKNLSLLPSNKKLPPDSHCQTDQTENKNRHTQRILGPTPCTFYNREGGRTDDNCALLHVREDFVECNCTSGDRCNRSFETTNAREDLVAHTLGNFGNKKQVICEFQGQVQQHNDDSQSPSALKNMSTSDEPGSSAQTEALQSSRRFDLNLAKTKESVGCHSSDTSHSSIPNFTNKQKVVSVSRSNAKLRTAKLQSIGVLKNLVTTPSLQTTAVSSERTKIQCIDSKANASAPSKCPGVTARKKHKIRQASITFGVDVCAKYNDTNGNTCTAANQCKLLHVCKGFINGDCKFGKKCNLCHSLETVHSKTVLAAHIAELKKKGSHGVDCHKSLGFRADDKVKEKERVKATSLDLTQRSSRPYPDSRGRSIIPPRPRLPTSNPALKKKKKLPKTIWKFET